MKRTFVFSPVADVIAEAKMAGTVGHFRFHETVADNGAGVKAEFFGAPMLMATLVDLVTHRAHILTMNGDSYRLKESKARNLRLASN